MLSNFKCYFLAAIKRSVRLSSYTGDREYMSELKNNLESAFNEFKPDLIIYNAGTDTLQDDPLGCLSLTSAVFILNILVFLIFSALFNVMSMYFKWQKIALFRFVC
jgi:hypothetical protein